MRLGGGSAPGSGGKGKGASEDRRGKWGSCGFRFSFRGSCGEPLLDGDAYGAD